MGSSTSRGNASKRRAIQVILSWPRHIATMAKANYNVMHRLHWYRKTRTLLVPFDEPGLMMNYPLDRYRDCPSVGWGESKFVRLLVIGWLISFVCWRAESSVAQVFDVVTWKESEHISEGISASGTVNGIGFDYTGPNWPPGVTTDSSFTGFADPQHHLPPLSTSDRIHIWDTGRFNFDTPISGLYLYMAQHPDSPGMDLIDFGIEPMVISGDIFTNGNIFGTTSVDGGLVYLPNINSQTLNFTSPPGGGPLCVDVALVVVPQQPFVDGTWNNDGTATWDDAENWNIFPATPNTAAHTATFADAISAPTTVVVNTDLSINAITFDHSVSYGVGGLGSVNLVTDPDDPNDPDDPFGPPLLSVSGGTAASAHQFQVVVNLQDNTTADVAANSMLSFNHALNLMGNTLTKTGAGTMSINNVLTTGGGSVDVQEGTVTGGGSIGGNVKNNGGTISPGNSAGTMEIAGDYVQTEEGTLLMEIAGTKPGSEYDLLTVEGQVSLDGVLEVALLEGFQPAAGDSFDLLDFGSLAGAFDNLDLPQLAVGLAWDTIDLYVDGSVSIIPEPCGILLLVLGLSWWVGVRHGEHRTSNVEH